MKRTSEQTTRSGHAATEAGGKEAKDMIRETSQAAEAGTDQAMAAGHRVTETVSETAGAAVELSSRAAEQSREALMYGMRTVADLGCRVADVSLGRGHH